MNTTDKKRIRRAGLLVNSLIVLALLLAALPYLRASAAYCPHFYVYLPAVGHAEALPLAEAHWPAAWVYLPALMGL